MLWLVPLVFMTLSCGPPPNPCDHKEVLAYEVVVNGSSRGTTNGTDAYIREAEWGSDIACVSVYKCRVAVTEACGKEVYYRVVQ